ncbi:unnamed protein product [Leptosia nina]|uniref:Uncharacterized protein n=1 Tax=Leptosia nina TaxID=320188 RepID=A0AAV1IWR6_9NEOP
MQTPYLLLFIAVFESEAWKHRRPAVHPSRDDDDSVDFGHIYRDPAKNARLFKGGNDLNSKDALAVITEPNIHREFLSPRDRILHEGRKSKMERNPEKNTSQSNMMYNFEALLDRNLKSGPMKIKPIHPAREPSIIDTQNKLTQISDFEEKNFLVRTSNLGSNWTTCDEFGKKAVFHPDDIVNLNFIPFYIWSSQEIDVGTVHRFTYPTKKLVQHFKTEYGPYLEGVNWKEPKLLLDAGKKTLLIAKDRRGSFHGIPDDELPESIKSKNEKIPVLNLRLKILDAYLALMYCDLKHAYIMALKGEEPKTEEDKTKAAEVLRFRGAGRPLHIVERRHVNQTKHSESSEVAVPIPSVIDLSLI